MDYKTISDVGPPVFAVLEYGVPAWLIFYPPRRMRALPFWYRPILALLTSMAGYYSFYYGFVRPAIDAYMRSLGSGVIVDDPIMFYNPSLEWGFISLYIILCLIVRSVWLVCSARTFQVSLIPDHAPAGQARPKLSAGQRVFYSGAIMVWSVAITVHSVCLTRFVNSSFERLAEYGGWPTMDWMILPGEIAFVASVAGCLALDYRFHLVQRGAWAAVERFRRRRHHVAAREATLDTSERFRRRRDDVAGRAGDS